MTAKLTAGTLIAFGFLILLAVIVNPRWQFPRHEQGLAKFGNEVVATIGTRSITLREIEQTAALSLYQADQQRSQNRVRNSLF